MVAATNPSRVQAKDGEPTLADLQQSDSALKEMIDGLERKILPKEKRGPRYQSQPVTVPDYRRYSVPCEERLNR